MTIKQLRKRDKVTNMADICEMAHKITVKECKKKGITVDKQVTRDETCYTAKAQVIFDRYYDILADTYNL